MNTSEHTPTHFILSFKYHHNKVKVFHNTSYDKSKKIDYKLPEKLSGRVKFSQWNGTLCPCQQKQHMLVILWEMLLGFVNEFTQ